MNKRLPLIVAGLVFAIVALAHLYRLYSGAEIVVAGTIVPMSVSVIGLLVAGVLAVWMFLASRS